MRKLILLATAVLLFALSASADVCREVGSFSSGTGAAASTVDVNFVTSTTCVPKVVILWTSADTSGSTADQSFAIGFGTSSSSRRSVWSGCLQSTDPSKCKNDIRNNLILSVYRGSTPTLSGSFDLTSFGTGTFRLTVGTQFVASITIFYLAIGGSDITTVDTATVVIPTATAPSDFSVGAGQWTGGVGFKPDFVLGVLCHNATSNSTSTDAACSLGFSDGTNAGFGAFVSVDGQNTSIAGNYLRAAASQLDFLAVVSTATSVTARVSMKTLDTNGFTMTNQETNANSYIIYALGIKGGQWHVGPYTAATTATTFDVTDGSFTPLGIGVINPRGTVQSTSDTAAAAARMGFGASDGTTSGAASTVGDDAVAANNAYFNNLSTSRVYQAIKVSDGTVLTDANFTSFLSNGWRGTVVTASSGNIFGTYFSFAANAASTTRRKRPVWF